MTAPGGGEIRLGGAYIDVNLRDHTQAEERRIRERFERGKPVRLGIEVDARQAAREVQRSREIAQQTADRNRISLTTEADRTSSLAAGRTAGQSFERGARQSMSNAGSQGGRDFGRQAGLSISQSVKLWTSVIAGATPLVSAAFGAALAGMPVAMAAAASATQPAVRASFRELKDAALSEVDDLGSATSGVFIRQMDKLRSRMSGIGAELGESVADAEPGIDRVTDGLADLAGSGVDSMRLLLSTSEPTFTGLGQFLTLTGQGLEGFSSKVAEVSEENGQNFVTLGRVVERTFNFLGTAAAGGARAMANNGATIEHTFDRLLDTVEGFASGAMAPLGHTVDFAVNALNGLMTILGPIDHLLGGVAGSALGFLGTMRLLRSATGGLTGGLGGVAAGATATAANTQRAGRSMGSFRAHMSDVRSEAGAMRRQLSLTDAAVITLGQRDTVLGRMQHSFATASSGATRFARTAGVARAGTSLLRSAGIGLAGVLGGPMGIALGAAVAGLSLLGSAQQAAADRMAEQQEQTKNWTQALIDSSGAIDGNVKTQVMLDLQQQKLGDGTTTLIQGFDQVGVSSERVWKAVSQGGPALQGIHDDLKQSADASNDMLNAANPLAKMFPELFKQTSQYADKTYELREALNRVAGQFQDARDAQQAYLEALNQSYSTTSNVEAANLKLGESLKAFAEAAGDSTKRGQALGAVYDQLHGNQLQLTGAQSVLGESFRKLRDAGGGFGDSVNKNTGQIDAFTKKGAELFDLVMPLRQGFFQYADAMTLTGKSVDQVAKSLGPVRRDFIRTAQGMGLSKQEARALADNLGLLPRKVAVDVAMQGMPRWNQAVESIRGKILNLTDSELTLGKGAQAAIPIFESMGYTVRKVGDKIVVDIDSQEGYDKIKGMLDYIQNSTPEMGLQVDPKRAMHQLGIFITDASSMVGQPKINPWLKDAYNKVGGFIADVTRRVGKPSIDPETKKAYRKLGSWMHDAASAVGRPQLDARPTPAHRKLGSWLKAATGAIGAPRLDSRPAPAYGVLGGWLGRANRSWARAQLGANPRFGEVLSFLAWINQQQANVRVGTTIVGGVGGIGRWHYGGVMRAHAEGGVEPAFSMNTSLRAEDGSEVRAGYYTKREGGQRMIMAEDGTYVPLSFYANGGQELTPAPRGRAMIDPPNSWRMRGRGVSGDRSDVDEYYLPDNSAPHTLQVLDQFLQRRAAEGHPYLKLYANGGTEYQTSSASRSSVSGAAVSHTYNVTAIVDPTKLKSIEDMQRFFDDIGRVARQGASAQMGMAG